MHKCASLYPLLSPPKPCARFSPSLLQLGVLVYQSRVRCDDYDNSNHNSIMLNNNNKSNKNSNNNKLYNHNNDNSNNNSILYHNNK